MQGRDAAVLAPAWPARDGRAPASHRIATGEDAHCQLLEWRSSGRPVLLLHGLGSNAATWLPFIRALDERFRPLALDLRGHGDSTWRSDYRIESFVRDLEVVSGWIGEPFALVGHSLGGEVALHFTARNPHGVRSLVLVDLGAHMDSLGRQRIRQDLASSARDYASPEEYLLELRNSYVLAEETALRSLAMRGVRRAQDGRYRLKLDPEVRAQIDPSPSGRKAGALPGLWDALGSIAVPSLVLRGAVSGVLRRDAAERIAGTLLAGRLEEIPRAGHAVMLDNPTAFARSALAFLRETVR